jgi:hypothetical protein
LVVLFEHKVSISEVKTLSLTFTGCTWQWQISIHLLVEGIVWNSIGLSLGRSVVLGEPFLTVQVWPLVVVGPVAS